MRASIPLTGSRTHNRLAHTPAPHRHTHLGSQGEHLTCSPHARSPGSVHGLVVIGLVVWPSGTSGSSPTKPGIGSELFWLTNEKSEILSMEPPAPSPLPFSSSVPSPPPGLPKRPQQSPPALEINHYPPEGVRYLPPPSSASPPGFEGQTHSSG